MFNGIKAHGLSILIYITLVMATVVVVQNSHSIQMDTEQGVSFLYR